MMNLWTAACVVAVIGLTSALPNPYSFDTIWEDFKETHGKTYSPEEDIIRKNIFHGNMEIVEIHNYMNHEGLKSFRLGINEYSDMDRLEFNQRMNGFRMMNGSTISGSTYMSPEQPITLPDTVDWRPKGYVTPVKNQGQCGSCWAFSSTGSLEGQHFRKTGKLVSLSEQNLMDCSNRFGNHGCQGGIMDYAFQYIKENDGIDTEISYPYTAHDGQCHYKAMYSGATDTGYVNLPQGDEDALKEAVASIGPIAVAIDASHFSFQSYQQGIYDEPNCSSVRLDHGVLVVGYGTEGGQDYWLVKNSWGSGWGMHGYLRMSRNKNNQCGIATHAIYPLV